MNVAWSLRAASVDRTWANGAGRRCNQVIVGPAEQRIGLSYILEIPGWRRPRTPIPPNCGGLLKRKRVSALAACRCIHPYADDTATTC
jgi:hypothetical protein